MVPFRVVLRSAERPRLVAVRPARAVVRRCSELGFHHGPGGRAASLDRAARTRSGREATRGSCWSTRRLSRQLPHGTRRGRDRSQCRPRRKLHRRCVGPARAKPPADLIDGFSESAILRLSISIGRLCGCVQILFRMPCGSASRRCCRPLLSVVAGTPDDCGFPTGPRSQACCTCCGPALLGATCQQRPWAAPESRHGAG